MLWDAVHHCEKGIFFISERVAWDMGRGARKNNPRRCVWVRPGARACLQAWRGVTWLAWGF